jgi:DNA-binding NtrC family response regulator
LRSEGFTPIGAHGGKRGLELLEQSSPDIILTDIRMPAVTGVEILAVARASMPDVPVILMTAQATLQSAMQAVNAGAFYYIQKPFQNDELLAILRRASEHRMLRVENRSLKQAIRRQDHDDVPRPVGTSGMARRAAHGGDGRADGVDGSDSGRVRHRQGNHCAVSS